MSRADIVPFSNSNQAGLVSADNRSPPNQVSTTQRKTDNHIPLTRRRLVKQALPVALLVHSAVKFHVYADGITIHSILNRATTTRNPPGGPFRPPLVTAPHTQTSHHRRNEKRKGPPFFFFYFPFQRQFLLEHGHSPSHPTAWLDTPPLMPPPKRGYRALWTASRR